MSGYRDRLINHDDGQQIVDALRGIRSALAKKATIYSFHVDNSESDYNAAVTYHDDAVNMSPAYMDMSAGVFYYGSWADAFFMPRPCMLKYDGTVDYYLNPNDYELKEDGTASDVANIDYGGNAMMEWGRDGQQIWQKIVPDAGNPTSYTVYISNMQVDDSYHAWSFVDKNNQLKKHFYTPIYQGSLDSAGRLRSISGQVHIKSKTASQEMAAAALNGDGYTIETFQDRGLINSLLSLIGKTIASQEAFGLGHTTDSWTEANMLVSGTMNKKGLFYGSTNSGAGGEGVKVFGMENWWGDQWRRTCGLIQSGGKLLYKLTQGTADGSSATDYNTDGTGYLDSGINLSGDGGYQSKNTALKTGAILPSELSGSESTYYTDYVWLNTSVVAFALFGAHLGNGRLAGARSVALYLAASYAVWNFGAAVSYR